MNAQACRLSAPWASRSALAGRRRPRPKLNAARPVTLVRAAEAFDFDLSPFEKAWDPRASLASWDQERGNLPAAVGWTSAPSALSTEPPVDEEWLDDASHILSKEWALASFEDAVNDFRHNFFADKKPE